VSGIFKPFIAFPYMHPTAGSGAPPAIAQVSMATLLLVLAGISSLL